MNALFKFQFQNYNLCFSLSCLIFFLVIFFRPTKEVHSPFEEDRRYDLPYSFVENDFKTLPSFIHKELGEKKFYKSLAGINIARNIENQLKPNQTNNSLFNFSNDKILFEISSDIINRYPLFQMAELQIILAKDFRAFIDKNPSTVILPHRLKEVCQTRVSLYFIIAHVLSRSFIKNKISSSFDDDVGLLADLMALEIINSLLPEYDALEALRSYRNIINNEIDSDAAKEWLEYHPQTTLEPYLTSLLLSSQKS